MAKTNPFLSLLDGSATLDATNIPTAIGGVPFVRHQFNWLLAQLAAKSPADAVVMLAGYTGVKKITPERAVRLEEMIRVLQAMTPHDRATFPLPTMPTPATVVKP
jgi:hypothetical protein